jgi:hypothetical protein
LAFSSSTILLHRLLSSTFIIHSRTRRFLRSFSTHVNCLAGSSQLVPSSLVLWRFRKSKFLLVGIVSPTPNPQPGGPGTILRLVPTFWLVWRGWRYQELRLPPA